MFATAQGKTIHVSADIGRSLVGVTEGYRVVLHALPAWTFHVEADTADKAQSIAHSIARAEHQWRGITDAATIQRL